MMFGCCEHMADNEVDWQILAHLTDNDWHVMPPFKVGIVQAQV